MPSAGRTERLARRVTAADILLLALLAAGTVVAGFMTRGRDRSRLPSAVEVVTAAGKRPDIPLLADGTHVVAGPLGESVFEIAAGRVRMKSSPCQNQICVREGWIGRSGDVIICVPNRVGIFLRGQDGTCDAVSR